eukprot:gene12856-biopygen1529
MWTLYVKGISENNTPPRTRQGVGINSTHSIKCGDGARACGGEVHCDFVGRCAPLWSPGSGISRRGYRKSCDQKAVTKKL